MERRRDRILVVGAGISGLTAALLLARRGFDVDIWEASDRPGGLLAPVDFQGLPCDRGSHRVHPDSHPLLRELTDDRAWEERPRRGELVLNGRHIPYPIDPVSFLRGLGWRAALDMGISWLTRPGVFDRFLTWEDDRRETPTERDKGFERFVIERVGESAYRRFYRPYVEKVWGDDPAEISQSVAKQRVSTSKPLESIVESLGFGDEVFLYPRSGMAGVTGSLADRAEEAGVEMSYERGYDPVRDGEGDSGAPPGFDRVVYTGPLPELVDETDLEYRGLYLLHTAVSSGAVDDGIDTWYVPEPDHWFGRVSQPENFSPEIARSDREVLCVEIPEGRWGRGVDFTDRIDTIRGQLERAGILNADAEIHDVRQTFLPRVYPRYVRNWYDEWEEALRAVRRLGDVVPAGRKGLFLHCNMDHCVAVSADLADHLAEGRPVSDWFDRCRDYLDLRVRD